MGIPTFRYPTFHRAYKSITPFIENKKTASYFTLTLSLISLSFFGLFAIRPTLLTATSLLKNIDDLKTLNTNYENKIGDMVRAQTEYEKIRNEIPLIDLALPANSGFSKLAEALEKFAKNSNITIDQLQIDDVPISNPQSTSKINSYGFSFIALGDYPSLTSFIIHILNWKRIVTLTNIQFSQNGSTTSGSLRMTLKGTTYYEP